MGTHTNDVHTCTLCVPSGAHIHMIACTSTTYQTAVQSQKDTQESTWRDLPDVPYKGSAVCVVDGVLLAIGGSDGSKETSAIYALHHVDQKWQHVGDMPFECSDLETLLLSDGRMLVVDGISQSVLRVTVEGKPCKCYGQYY